MTASSMLISGKKPTVSVSGIFSTSETRSSQPATTGKAGDIRITSGQIELTSGGEINASTNRGGGGGNISITTDQLDVSDGSRISTASSSSIAGSDGGSITIDTNQLTLLRGGVITAATLKQLPRFTDPSIIPIGNAGNITLSTPNLRMDGTGTAISSITEGSGAAGVIMLNGETITLSNGAKIASSAEAGSTGLGGNVTLIGDHLNVMGGTDETASFGANRGGNILVKATGDATLSGGIVLTAQSTGGGDAGNIRLEAGNNLLLQSATVTTSASEASGGDIKLAATNIVRLIDSQLISSVQGGSTSNGGNITIDPLYVVLQNSQILAKANQGAGGNISIVATSAVLVDPNSGLDASSALGINGSINIQAPIQNLSGAIVPLKQGLLQTTLSGDRCAAMKDGQFSSFVMLGRDAVPPEPGGFVSSPARLESVSLQGSAPIHPNLVAQRLGLLPAMPQSSPLFVEMGCGS